MAGYGGFGGLGASYPMRFGAPQSQQVQSDQEFGQEWQNKLASVPQYISSGGGSMGYAAPEWQQAVAQNNAYGGADASALLGVEQGLNAIGLTYNRKGDADQGTMIQRAADLQPQTTAVAQTLNPEYEKMRRDMEAAQASRGSNQMAQQQAYNGMAGDGLLNGVINANYSQPGFGQVTGSANPYSTDQAVAAGVTIPGQTTGVYNPASTAKSFWGL